MNIWAYMYIYLYIYTYTHKIILPILFCNLFLSLKNRFWIFFKKYTDVHSLKNHNSTSFIMTNT